MARPPRDPSQVRRRRAPESRRRAQAAARRNTRSDLSARVLVAIPAIIGAILLVAQGGIVFALGLFALGSLCLAELFAMMRPVRPAALAGYLGLLGLLLAAHFGDEQDVLLAAVLAVPVLFALTLARPAVEHATLSMAVVALGLIWIGLALAHAVLLRELPHGDGIVIDVLVGTFVGDTAAYLGGRAFGRRPLAPRISPNKTVEGLACGFVVGALATWFAGLYQEWLSGTDAILLGLAVAAVAPVGDLFESFIKRDAGTKDTGRAFGAHGGALDRLDAVFFTAVAGFYVWSAMV